MSAQPSLFDQPPHRPSQRAVFLAGVAAAWLVPGKPSQAQLDLLTGLAADFLAQAQKSV